MAMSSRFEMGVSKAIRLVAALGAVLMVVTVVVETELNVK